MDSLLSPGSLDAFDFAAMMAPMPLKDFRPLVGMKPVHVPGALSKFDFAMSWDLLNGVLNQTGLWSPRTMVLVQDTTKIPPEQFMRPGLGRDGQMATVADLDKVRGFLRKGASLVLNGVERLTPGMARLSEILAQEFACRIGTNLYCSWRRHQAFSVHFDTHDVFAFQIAGTKAWRIYQRHFKDPVHHARFKLLDNSFHAANKGGLSMEFVMKPGDLVYIPSGYYHEALATSEASIHLSYSVTPMRGLDVLTVLFEKCIEDENLRAPLPDPACDAPAFHAATAAFVARLREKLRDPEVRAALLRFLDNYTFVRERIELPGDSGGES